LLCFIYFLTKDVLCGTWGLGSKFIAWQDPHPEKKEGRVQDLFDISEEYWVARGWLQITLHIFEGWKWYLTLLCGGSQQICRSKKISAQIFLASFSSNKNKIFLMYLRML